MSDCFDIYDLAEENELLKTKIQIAIEALTKIANEDFRGNRPHSAVIAYNALKKINENN